MGLTLVEAAKLSKDAYRSGIIEIYAGSSAILGVLPFENISGNALKYNRESTLPGVGFRGVNEGYTPSTGVLNPLTENLVIAGGELDVDKFIVQTMGADQRTVQEAMKVRSLSLSWTSKFFNGDSVTNPREFDGLKKRVTGSQLLAAGTTSGGTPLSLSKLDEALDQTLNPSYLVMNKTLARRISQAARKYDVGGYVTFTTDTFGKRVMAYNGIPIITIDLDNEGNEILPFTEVSYTSSAWGGTASASSIYVISVGPDMLTGIQNGEIAVDDLGVLQSSPLYRTRVEWYCGIAIFNGRAVTRLGSISDAAVTA